MNQHIHYTKYAVAGIISRSADRQTLTHSERIREIADAVSRSRVFGLAVKQLCAPSFDFEVSRSMDRLLTESCRIVLSPLAAI